MILICENYDFMSHLGCFKQAFERLIPLLPRLLAATQFVSGVECRLESGPRPLSNLHSTQTSYEAQKALVNNVGSESF